MTNFCSLAPRLLAWSTAMAAMAAAQPAAATDLHYALMSPNFGGTNPVAFQMAQYNKALQAARAAAEAAAARTATPPDPNQAFVNAIISQLNGIVAQTIAQRIANAGAGQAGTIQSGAVTITYMNSDGQLTVTITTPAGSTTLTIPAGA
ncbi:curli assembly protein CsgF [Phenylobacterium sp.]|uniref:curli assembly protein CsgF n=1 Tax=Phenylobacterium sp. TaxID=1871053 RepID=UPI0025D3CBD0|nr:curli assembly protein CsgF [Phenylobacterium sp.]